MEQYTNAYYDNYHTATTEAERSRIKAEFEAVFAVLTENQRREVKAILMKRIDERMAKLAPLDEANPSPLSLMSHPHMRTFTRTSRSRTWAGGT